MKKDKLKTQVIFYRVFETEHCNEHILAFFPKEHYYNKYHPERGKSDMFMSYAHIGQHGPCSKEYILDRGLCEPCEYEEQFKDLKAELESLGYNLTVKNCIRVIA